MESHGEKLNKFNRESLNSFNEENEWSDFVSLVCDPVKDSILFYDNALRKIYELADGHPYFTKSVCSAVFDTAVDSRDSEISEVEVNKAAQRLLEDLDVNAFVHYWRDGARGDKDEQEVVSVNRCRTLVAWARTVREGVSPTFENIEQRIFGNLRSDELRVELDDFCGREVFCVKNGAYYTKVKLFGEWLQNSGFSKLVDGKIGDEIKIRKQAEEDEAYVRSDEISKLIDAWPLYQGHRITEESVRSWLNQVETNVSKRYLFKLLENTRFVSNDQVHEGFRDQYKGIHRDLPVLTSTKRSQYRHDILVSYLGRFAKSGSHYAKEFAKVNKIYIDNVVPPSELCDRLERDHYSSVIFVDDMIGTGNSIKEELDKMKEVLTNLNVSLEVRLSICVFCATTEGFKKVGKYIERSFGENCEVLVCELLEKENYAFNENGSLWDSGQEEEKARKIITELGARVQKRQPLGYMNQGLLLTFPQNCPNNSLPILFSKKGDWDPIFPRNL